MIGHHCLPRVRRTMGAACAALICAMSPGHALGVSSREMVELTDVDSLSVSPDGQFAVFRTVRADLVSNSHVLRWHAVDLGNGRVRPIGSGGDPIYIDPGAIQPEMPVWTNEGRSVVVRALVGGAIGLWLADVDGQQMTPLIVRDEDIEEYRAASDGRSILYKVGPSRDEIARAEQREYDSGILVDSSIDLAQNLYRGGSINGRMASQRLVGFWFVRSGLLWRAPRQERQYDLPTGADTPVGDPIIPGPFAPPPSPTQSRNAYGDDVEADWDGEKGSVRVRFSDGRTLHCKALPCGSQRIANLAWRPGTRDVLLTVMDRERRQSLFLWSTRANRLRPVTSADGLIGGGRRNFQPCALSSKMALCVVSGPASPPRVERVDLESGDRRILFDPNEGFRTSYQPKVQYLHWDIGGGRQATGVLLKSPTGNGPAPLYLNYYACEGFLRGGEGDEWPMPELLDAGFAVACVNAVPSTGPQDSVEAYRTGLAAVRSLIEKLAQDGVVDPSKVAMGGLSFGSEVAMWTAMQSSLLSAVSIASGQFEPATYWIDAVPGSDRPGMIRKAWGLGTPEETPERWRLVSPALNAEKIRAPILFQLPEQEARRVAELHARIAIAGTPVELYAFPDEAHVKIQPRHRLAIYQRNLDWFRYWLQDYRDVDPAKAEQYRRWDILRQGQVAEQSTTP